MNKTVEKIKELAAAGNFTGSSVEEIFARVYGAVEKALKITPFDEQLAAALALYDGKMVQMQTGEGKTLCAVFAACCTALNGKRTHVLTFNDYLARRDCDWMKPVYDEMGVDVGCITEDTPREERRSLYQKQVLYITAKEAGFDYLKNFVCFDTKEICFAMPDFAIFDEADSILIDEARIPLVIAGDVAAAEDESTARVYAKIGAFGGGDYEFDEDSRNIYLTDKGADKAEKLFSVGNIYDAENAELLAKVTACIKARDVLTEDKDYIVKDGKIVLIDEFTGRAAAGRVFPGELQPACEAKHRLKITSRGRIMGSIALQYFARLYPKIAGMTGTAEQSREEFEKFYGILTEIIPTRLPCRRIDHPLEIYCDRSAKRRAIIAAVCEAHEMKRPVLVGTESIEESESMARGLREKGVGCAVLNAKNNFEEAAIIAKAGERGAVTISTNMAGRGVDIKLGGKDCADKDFVTSVGGLLVIITSMRESSRIAQQLRGRAGRQGDVGESRLFAALDDEIMVKNDLKRLCGRHYPKSKSDDAVTDKTVLKEAERVRRISEGDAFDDRVNLMKYTLIGEKHREMTFSKRNALLDGEYNSDMWKKSAPELYEEVCGKFGADTVQALENKTLAALLNEFHSDYLDYTAYLREGIHLTQIAGRNPAEEYNIACEEYYESAAETLPERMEKRLAALADCANAEDYRIVVPTGIYTYLLNDLAEEFKAKPILLNVFSDEDFPDDSPVKPEKADKSENGGENEGFFKRLLKKK